jgi:hypothetical protein
MLNVKINKIDQVQEVLKMKNVVTSILVSINNPKKKFRQKQNHQTKEVKNEC